MRMGFRLCEDPAALPPLPPDPVRARLEVLAQLAREEAKRFRRDLKCSRRWNYFLVGAVVVGGLIATVSGSIASQGGDATRAGYFAGFAGAVVTACSAAILKFKPVEKLQFAVQQFAAFEGVALRAENGLADGSGADLVTALTNEFTEYRGRVPPD